MVSLGRLLANDIHDDQASLFKNQECQSYVFEQSMSCLESSSGADVLHSYGSPVDGNHASKRLSSAHTTMKTMKYS